MAAVDVQAANDAGIPSHMRCAPGSVNIHVANIPPSAPFDPADVDKNAAQIVEDLNKAISAQDFSAIANLFADDGYLRDHLVLSWRFRTLHTPSRIQNFLQECAGSRDGFKLSKVALDSSNSARRPQLATIEGLSAQTQALQFFVSVQSKLGKGRGVIRALKQDDGSLEIFTMFLTLEELDGHGEALNERRPQGVEHGGKPDRKNWSERRVEDADLAHGRDPVCLIVGGGQAGLTAAARLKMLGVDALIIDQNNRLGDNWRKRYHQLVLHDPVWFDHLPFVQFPAQWPVFTPKDKLAQFFEAYATLLELNAWTSTSLVDSQWDESSKTWTVVLKRKREDGSVEERTLRPRHIIQATGHSGKKNQPDIKGTDSFQGDKLCHSSEFPGANPDSKGKKAVVVGSCNSAHDIAQDYLEKGYDITIVQRSTTCVISSEANTQLGLGGLYCEGGPPVEDADLIFHGLPSSVLKATQQKLTALQNNQDRAILDGLAKAGFKIDQGPDDAGLLIKYVQRGGGYYIEVGASKLIADGKIKVKNAGEITEVLSHGLLFGDGSELAADEIVFATGYQNMRTETRTIFGDAVADRVDDVWGLNEEGEIKTMWQRTGHPGFWFHGGNLALCRYNSRLLALQIKALEEGLYEE